jgi:hypothetical protein
MVLFGKTVWWERIEGLFREWARFDSTADAYHFVIQYCSSYVTNKAAEALAKKKTWKTFEMRDGGVVEIEV